MAVTSTPRVPSVASQRTHQDISCSDQNCPDFNYVQSGRRHQLSSSRIRLKKREKKSTSVRTVFRHRRRYKPLSGRLALLDETKHREMKQRSIEESTAYIELEYQQSNSYNSCRSMCPSTISNSATRLPSTQYPSPPLSFKHYPSQVRSSSNSSSHSNINCDTTPSPFISRPLSSRIHPSWFNQINSPLNSPCHQSSCQHLCDASIRYPLRQRHHQPFLVSSAISEHCPPPFLRRSSSTHTPFVPFSDRPSKHRMSIDSTSTDNSLDGVHHTSQVVTDPYSWTQIQNPRKSRNWRADRRTARGEAPTSRSYCGPCRELEVFDQERQQRRFSLEVDFLSVSSLSWSDIIDNQRFNNEPTDEQQGENDSWDSCLASNDGSMVCVDHDDSEQPQPPTTSQRYYQSDICHQSILSCDGRDDNSEQYQRSSSSTRLYFSDLSRYHSDTIQTVHHSSIPISDSDSSITLPHGNKSEFHDHLESYVPNHRWMDTTIHQRINSQFDQQYDPDHDDLPEPPSHQDSIHEHKSSSFVPTMTDGIYMSHPTIDTPTTTMDASTTATTSPSTPSIYPPRLRTPPPLTVGSSSTLNNVPTPALPPQLQNAVRIPAEVIAEMFSSVSKGARLRTEFVRKCEAVQYLMGIPWLEHSTRKWIRCVLCLQLFSWIFSVLSTASAAFSERIPRFIPALLAPFLTLHHFVGYLSFARRSPILSAIYCIIVVVTAALQGMQLAISVRSLLLHLAATSPLIVTSLSSLFGLFADLSLFFAAATLFLRMRYEESEMRVLIPVETLEETPNDLPFLRWYFNLPLGHAATTTNISSVNHGNRAAR